MIVCDECGFKIDLKSNKNPGPKICYECPEQETHFHKKCLTLVMLEGWDEELVCSKHIPKCHICQTATIATGNLKKYDPRCNTCNDDGEDCVFCPNHLTEVDKHAFCPDHLTKYNAECESIAIVNGYTLKMWEDIGIPLVQRKNSSFANDKYKIRITYELCYDDVTELLTDVRYEVTGIVENGYREYMIPIRQHEEAVSKMKQAIMRSLRSKVAFLTSVDDTSWGKRLKKRWQPLLKQLTNKGN